MCYFWRLSCHVWRSNRGSDRIADFITRQSSRRAIDHTNDVTATLLSSSLSAAESVAIKSRMVPSPAAPLHAVIAMTVALPCVAARCRRWRFIRIAGSVCTIVILLHCSALTRSCRYALPDITAYNNLAETSKSACLYSIWFNSFHSRVSTMTAI